MGIAQLVERCLAKAKVAGSNPVSHSIKISHLDIFLFHNPKFIDKLEIACWLFIIFSKAKVVFLLMKSIVQEGSTVLKAVEKALQIAGNPREFTVKVLEEPQKNFFGMTTRSAKISLLFDTVIQKVYKTEKQQVEQPKTEKKRFEQREQKPEKQRPTRTPKPPKAQKPKLDGQTFWTDTMVEMAKNWLKSTISKMDHVPVDFETDINRYYLRVTFDQPLHSDEEKERQIFRSFSYLILQSLRTKLQRPLRGFKVVLTRG